MPPFAAHGFAVRVKLLTNQPAQFPLETALAVVRRGAAPNPALSAEAVCREEVVRHTPSPSGVFRQTWGAVLHGPKTP